MITDPRIPFPHGFFTREGGISSGLYGSLNAGIGSDDEPEAVIENRRRMAQALGTTPERLATPYQVHSADAVATEGPWTNDRPKADGVATAAPGLAVGIVTADCGPILFANVKAGVVAAAHAGWKGALYGIIEATLARMEELGAHRRDSVAVLGPTIGPDSYEVDDTFRNRFLHADRENARFFEPAARAGHVMFDLPSYIVARLERSGVESGWTGHDTYGDEARFFSYRRTTHRNEPDYGRQLSAILVG